MSARKSIKFLQVQDDDEIKVFLKFARSIWHKAHPGNQKPKGRPSQTTEDLSAIKAIASGNASVSKVDFELWPQSKWIKAIGAFKNESAPGEVAIKKNLRRAMIEPTFPLPIHLISPTIVQSQSVDDQLSHWYAVAILKAMVTTIQPNSLRSSISYDLLDSFHRELCLKHMSIQDRPAEPRRKQWLADRLKRLRQVPISSRKSSASKG